MAGKGAKRNTCCQKAESAQKKARGESWVMPPEMLNGKRREVESRRESCDENSGVRRMEEGPDQGKEKGVAG